MGPGLGVRILGEVKKEYADVLREAHARRYEWVIALLVVETIDFMTASNERVGVSGTDKHQTFIILPGVHRAFGETGQRVAGLCTT